MKFKYGQQAYDFDEGVSSFMSPGQISEFDPQKFASAEQSGWLLLFHPDLLWNTPLAKKNQSIDPFLQEKPIIKFEQLRQSKLHYSRINSG